MQSTRILSSPFFAVGRAARWPSLVVAGALLTGAGCGSSEKKPDDQKADAKAEAPAEKTAPPPAFNRIDRPTFNRTVAELAVPLFWRADDNADNTLDPSELAVVWGMTSADATDWSAWLKDGAFTPEFVAVYEKAVAVSQNGHPRDGLDDAEKTRRDVVVAEVSQGRPTLVFTDLRESTEQDRAIVTHVLNAANLIEVIHAKQIGSFGLDVQIPEDDSASKLLFYRNQGPWCVSPKTESDPNCHAIPAKPKKISGMYPAALQDDPKFCEALAKHKNTKELIGHFNVVVDKDGKLEPVPYTVAYASEMKAIHDELKAAAAAITSDDEAAFKAYLTAAADAFLSNDWEPANAAWAKMGTDNSKWYLRIGPDEVYFEPCGTKAGFHVSFARINPDSVVWTQKLDPVKIEMENALAKLAGSPYKARKVAFKLPDFIDIIVNAGDARSPYGATVGQSLPNWGPVAAAGGRTVAMTNLYTDPDSQKAVEIQKATLLCHTTYALGKDSGDSVMGTVLHEAAHNLGPSHEYKVNKKTAPEIFSGPTASTLEELKAQTSSLYFIGWLKNKNLLTEVEANQGYVRNIVWAFGHISRGMYTAEGSPRSYSQLAAIQVGAFLDDGGLVWKKDEKAENGTDVGCFEIDLAKLPAAVEKLEKTALQIKAKGDKKAAAALIKKYVDDKGDWSALRETIAERWLRAEKGTFVYAIQK